jgi:hypothetical protein
VLDPTGRYIAYEDVGGHEVNVAEESTCKTLHTFERRSRDSLHALDVSADGRTVIRADTSGLVTVWRDDDPSPILELAGDGEALVARGKDGRVARVGGDRIDHLLRCRMGDEVLPFALCDERFAAEGWLKGVLTAKGDARPVRRPATP